MANFFETARLLGIKRLVYASSETVYGEQSDYGDREIVEDDRLLPFPGSVYALSKCLAEVFAAQYDELYGIKSTALRPCIGYGHGGKDPMFVRWFSNIVSLPAVGKPAHLECTGDGCSPPSSPTRWAISPDWRCAPTRRRTPPTTWAARR